MRKDTKPYEILIVEDNLGDFILIEEYLAENILDAHIHHVHSFREAKILLEDASKKIDVIFLDLSLPDLSGEELIVRMIEIASGLPVVALTGFSDLEFSIRSLSLGISDYLLKDDLTPTILYKSIIYSIQRGKFTEQIQKSEKRYSDLFQLSPLPMWVFDAKTSEFLNINKAAVQHYGYSEAEFLRMKIEDIRPQEDLVEMKKIMEAIRSGAINLSKNVSRHRKKSGEIIIVESIFKQLHFNDREAVLVLINDITERNRYIKTIEKQNQAFMEIAWIQSHIVRAPLARLLGLVYLLESENPDMDGEVASLMGLIKDSAAELDEIIRDISKKTETIERLDHNDS